MRLMDRPNFGAATRTLKRTIGASRTGLPLPPQGRRCTFGNIVAGGVRKRRADEDWGDDSELRAFHDLCHHRGARRRDAGR